MKSIAQGGSLPDRCVACKREYSIPSVELGSLLLLVGEGSGEGVTLLHATGIDVVELDRIARVLKRHPERFLARVFTPAEADFCRGRVPELAARFAAKEATMKALGTGIRGAGWREIEVLPNRRGKPLLLLHGRAAQRAEILGLTDVDVSLTTARDFAAAVVVGHITALPENEREPRMRRGRT
jgi:holo-[acyl-carrier protein] synthase